MTTNQSSSFDQYGKSDNAVDGIIEIESEYLEPVQSCIATQIENSPWWMVDLGGIFQIEVVTITNKVECLGDMLSEVELTISKCKSIIYLQAFLPLTWQDLGGFLCPGQMLHIVDESLIFQNYHKVLCAWLEIKVTTHKESLVFYLVLWSKG